MFVSNSGSGGYEIANSLRFRSSASAYLSRTSGTPTNNNIWTYSVWAKRGALGVATRALLNVYLDANNFTQISFNANDQLNMSGLNGGVTFCNAVSTSVYRDPSAHLHLVVAVDRSQATDSNRIKMYVNGVEITAWATSPTFNNAFNSYINNASRLHEIGKFNTSYLDGYLSEINFIDGQALTPASFGQTDSNGVWTPKQYSGTYGTNGFYLKFNDGSSTTNLCLDRSGNGNNWTPNNISVTAGATYDWMSDTPTNNYCTLNPLKQTGGAATALEGNLRVTSTQGSWGFRSSTMPVSSAPTYWETLITAAPNGSQNGIAQEAVTSGTLTVVGSAYVVGNGRYWVNGVETLSGAPTIAVNDVVQHQFDSGTYRVAVNGGFWFTVATGLTGQWFATIGGFGSSDSSVANFGQRPFAYTLPTGFKALCTANLPAVTIANPKRHFDAKLYVGNGATQNVTGIDFQPDLVWYKDRSVARDHSLFDVIRGASQGLSSNLTQAETTYSGVSGFLSNGFSLGNSVNGNANTETYVAWLWKANGSAVTNTSGTITSTVSANTTAGFSIVTYTGTGANATVGHGLGVAPKMVIVKQRTTASATSWYVWHSGLTSAAYSLYLNLTNAQDGPNAVFWNSTAPTSTVFSIGTSTGVSANTGTYVAYCFAEVPGFSRIGSYTGNGSADGPFVFCGFRPRWVLIKNTTAATSENWYVYDTVRSTFNVMGEYLYPNAASAEATFTTMDITANGFKLRTANSAFNTSGNTYIFIAFAESAFGGANIAPSPAR